MASVYSRGEKWYIRFRDNRGRWRSKVCGAASKTEAKRMAAELGMRHERQRMGLEALPAEDGGGAYRCMASAVKRAGIDAADIDYINAHGTSTPMGDEIELAAVERLFGNAAGKVSMSSTKSAIGHLLGAAGAVEAIFSALAIRDNLAPPTLNLDNPSVATAIDLVPHQARRRTIDTVVSNSFGFGGTNASLIFRRLDA